MDWNLIRPRTWPLWLAFGVLRVVIVLPFPLLVSLGRAMGRLLLPLARGRAAIARRNIELCFPELDGVAREQLLRDHFAALGISLMEFGLAWWASDRRLAGLGEVVGLENLESAARAGKGVLMLSAHFTCLELCGRLLTRHFAFVAMYRPSDNPVVEYLMARARARATTGIIPRDDVKAVIRSLRRGNTVWYAPDQNTGRRKAVFVDFFGHKVATTPATSRLAGMTGARVVPFKVARKRDGSGYLLTLEAPLEDFPSGDQLADTQRTNDVIERWVREYPEQYLWIHRRFRTRPDRSDPKIY
ncbi:MAG: LpxL/LpxP family Kdo(2)-lipid IV(A) lauroyl/palmitoleoyl acyltransferase [Chromatiaceae bacterium]|nr:LpxL/LpxP family Kdo(2)-lipid IV(A) lauroyl/palmitoleoyl acyltransferase [Chromatiaceae bacterium]